MIFQGISQAILEIWLELTLTFVFLLALSGLSFYLGRVSLKSTKKSPVAVQKDTPPMPHWTPEWARPKEAVDEELQKNWWLNFWQGISTEMVGAVITTFAFGVVLLIVQQYQEIQNRRIIEAQAIETRKAELILQLGSPDRGFAIEAARQLESLGWTRDGTLEDANLGAADLQSVRLQEVNLQRANLSDVNLQEAFLYRANLQGARLQGADLQGADLTDADLQGAYMANVNLAGMKLFHVNLQGTDLRVANMQGVYVDGFTDLSAVDLSRANLQEAFLSDVNLEGADLEAANLQNAYMARVNLKGANLALAELQGAHLEDANLEGASLTDATFDEKMVLPDAEYARQDDDGRPIFDKYWTPDTDMTRYTDPDHPDFWQPDWVKNGDE